MARIGELIGPNGEVMHPKTSASVVYLEDGRSVEQVLSDDIDYGNVVFQDNSYKFDSDVEDDFAKTVVIKGQTYQNILPEPSTHVLTNNKEMFKVNEGLDPNVEIVDGVSKSAILSGQTLVNLLKPTSHSSFITYDNGVITFTNPHGPGNISFSADMLKPSTKYFFKANFKCDSVWDYDFRTDLFPDNFPELAKFTPTTQGSDCYQIFTTPSNIDELISFRIYVSKAVNGVATISNAMLLEYQEGMENWDIPYFEGMQSVKMPVLKATGKNLFNFENGGQINGLMFSNNGANNYTVSGTCTKDNTDFYAVSKDRNSGTFTRLNSLPIGTKIAVSKSSSVGRQVYLSITQKDGSPTKYVQTYTTTNNDNVIHCFIRFMNGDTFDNEQLNLQIEIGSTATSYEPYKSNILHTPEEVVLSKVNDAIDTLNLNTGEYVKRVKEIVLDGSEPNSDFEFKTPTESSQTVRIDYMGIHDAIMVSRNKINCDRFLVTYDDTNDYEHVRNGMKQYRNIIFYINKSRLSELTLNGFKQWLSQNPVRLQYELATPIIKTVDLSSSGNWEKVVLDGSEDEVWHNGDSSWANKIFRLDGARHTPNIINSANALVETGLLFSSHFEEKGMNHLCNVKPQPEGVSIYGDSIFVGSPQISTIGELRTWLSQNPITVWYQTTTHKDSTQVKQPIFFKDGHIQLSSGTDHSLIPTLDYQAKTSNSYVMDLMKTNTKYTMKAKSANGTFTIDGTSYGAGTNGTFTTPTSMANKFLVMSNKTNKEVMILEGDVVSKTIPYFKGIKSAFEDESKIEVLSTGKNLTNLDICYDTFMRTVSGTNRTTFENGVLTLAWNGTVIRANLIENVFKPNTQYTLSYWCKAPEGYTWQRSMIRIQYTDGTELRLSSDSTSSTDFTRQILVSEPNKTVESVYVDLNNVLHIEQIQLEEGTVATEYEPYKSNSTKIPLLSPLRSLPNGVCDELIVDRENNKAKIIQRVGELDFSNLQYNTWNVSDSTLSKTVRFTWLSSNMSFYKVKDSSDGICDSILYMRYNSSDAEHCRFDGSNPSAFMIWVDKSKLTSFDDKGLKKYLSTLPSTRVQYELAAPVITEVDLEGFPYIYKEGHIFLSEGIAPTVGVEYSLNQGQRIAGQVETLQRHEKQFSKLEQYFADLVYSDYNFALLRFSEKLRQQEGDI